MGVNGLLGASLLRFLTVVFKVFEVFSFDAIELVEDNFVKFGDAFEAASDVKLVGECAQPVAANRAQFNACNVC